ncbi:TetR/AcrR family transcriptional regulator [Tsukamurella sputi]|uniref:TetR/AcrR family transcriptional regulator n=1 Tax=Tsukamurella sputi TaxID=2591848 RepID=A0A5C5RLA2_9ACTN|nr:TetR/AcrR family transcriptional regulator [Tsukamurella sputi]TWS23253.1 TetR/AcrR family transcriptional regulator [Tsukamurella sputi]
MSTPQPSTDVRETLVSLAHRIVDSDGVDKLTVRRLAAEAGVSTMAVYTRFGSVGAVAAAVRERGFGEFADLMESVGETADPLADLYLQGLLYLRFAAAHPHLYSLMFQYTSPEWAAGQRAELVQNAAPAETEEGARAFGAMRRRVARAYPGGDTAITGVRAGEAWASTHGIAMLAMARLLAPEALDAVTESMMVALSVGHGARHADAADAFSRARGRLDPR